MFAKLFDAWLLMALCVALHAMGMAAIIRWLEHRIKKSNPRFGTLTGLLICLAGWTILIHLTEISAWGFYYVWREAMPDVQTALYFSAVTYTTTGYGDLVLPKEWRLLGGVEAITGILMCGWSTGVFFAIVGQFHERQKNLDSRPIATSNL